MSTFLTEIGDLDARNPSFADSMRRHQNKWASTPTQPTIIPHVHSERQHDDQDQESHPPVPASFDPNHLHSPETITNTHRNSISTAPTRPASPTYSSNSSLRTRRSSTTTKNVHWKDDPSPSSTDDSTASSSPPPASSTSSFLDTRILTTTPPTTHNPHAKPPQITWSPGPSSAFGRVHFSPITTLPPTPTPKPAPKTSPTDASSSCIKLSYKITGGSGSAEKALLRATM
ncbi:hypothetical protein HDU98_002387, partial [Podochytrium sp. JEL0797]